MSLQYRNLRSRFLLSAVPLAMAGAIAASGAAYAQVGEIETVTVTAQKTAQDIQKVPIAVTAFTAQALEDKGITDVSSLSNSAPNVTFDAGVPFGASGSVLAAYIRGIGQNDFAFNQDPGVGVYVDGVYLARSVGANTDLLDVERIEVLKGPQGDLFGRNTIGGAISIVTRDPGEKFAYKAEITGGSRGRLDVRGYVDIPLSDTLRTSISFSEQHQDGFLKRVPFPTSGPLFDQAAAGSGLYAPPGSWAPFYAGGGDCYGAVSCSTIVDPTTAGIMAKYRTSDREGGNGKWNVRGKAVWNATPTLKFTLTGDYSHEDSPAMATRPIKIDANYIPPGSPGPSTTLGSVYNTCISSPAAFLGFLSGIPGVPNFPVVCGPRGTAGSTYAPTGADFANRVAGTLFGVNLDGNPSNNRLAYGPWFVNPKIDESYATGVSYTDLKQYGGALTIDYDVTDNTHLKSITAMRGMMWSAGLDGDGSPLNIHELSFTIGQHEFSQEVNLTGKLFGDKLDYVLGLYYFQEGGTIHDYVTFPGLLLQVDGNNILHTKSYASYYHLTYHLTDKLSIIAGGRYTMERKDFQGFQSDPNALVYKIVPLTIDVGPSGGPPVIIPLNCWQTVGDPITNACRMAMGFPDPNNPLRFYPPGTHKLNFDNFAPHFGVQYQATDDVMVYASYSEGFKTGSWTTRLSSPHPTYDPSLHFGPEKAKSGEIGLKSEFNDHRMRLNAAAFYTKYSGIQLNFQVGISPTLLNAGDASIWGGEIEYTALLSDHLTLNANLGYTHAQYDSVTPGVGSNGVYITTASKLPKTPEWKFNISPQYRMPLENGANLIGNLDYTYTAKLYNDVQNTSELTRPATNMLNASLTYASPDDQWEITVGGKNLTDDRYIVTGVNQGGIQLIYGSYNAPREWFATLRVKS